MRINVRVILFAGSLFSCQSFSGDKECIRVLRHQPQYVMQDNGGAWCFDFNRKIVAALETNGKIIWAADMRRVYAYRVIPKGKTTFGDNGKKDTIQIIIDSQTFEAEMQNDKETINVLDRIFKDNLSRGGK